MIDQNKRIDSTVLKSMSEHSKNGYGDAIVILEGRCKNLSEILCLAICHGALAHSHPHISPEEFTYHIDKAISATEKALQLLHAKKSD